MANVWLYMNINFGLVGWCIWKYLCYGFIVYVHPTCLYSELVVIIMKLDIITINNFIPIIPIIIRNFNNHIQPLLLNHLNCLQKYRRQRPKYFAILIKLG